MNVRPYSLIGHTAVDQINNQLDHVLTDWVTEWLAGSVDVSLDYIMPLSQCDEDILKRPKMKVSWLDETWCAYLNDEKSNRELGVILLGKIVQSLGDVSQSKIIPLLAEPALIELAQRFMAGTNLAYQSLPASCTDDDIPEWSLQDGSGAYRIRLNIEKLFIDFILSPATMQRYIEPKSDQSIDKQSSLTPVVSAVGNDKLTATAQLGSAMLSMHELANIRIGDVIMLDNSVNEPSLSIKFENSDTVCRGYVGRMEKNYAIQVVNVDQIIKY